MTLINSFFALPCYYSSVTNELYLVKDVRILPKRIFYVSWRKLQEAGGNCTLRNFITFTLSQIILGL